MSYTNIDQKYTVGSGRRQSRWLWFAVVICFSLSPLSEASIIRVKAGADAANTSLGASWSEPTNLENALATAVPADEIWVAAGVYRPASTSGFALGAGVAVYGGFTGEESFRHQRLFDSSALSVLSGDIAGDDEDLDGNGMAEDVAQILGENCGHVVTATGMVPGTVLDGFVITAGDAIDAGELLGTGGGLMVSDGRITIANCRFIGNRSSDRGGAIAFTDSDGEIFNCLFTANLAAKGSAVALERSSPEIINCTVTNNASDSNFGALHFPNSSPAIRNCIVWGNTSGGYGGLQSTTSTLGINIESSDPRVAHSIVERFYFYSTPTRVQLDVIDDGDNLNVDPLLLLSESISPSLAANSPAIDVGDFRHLLADLGDADGDGDRIEAYPFDPSAGLPRINGSKVDIGFTEFAAPRASSIEQFRFLPNAAPDPAAIQLADVFDDSAVSFSLLEVSPVGSLPDGSLNVNVDPASGDLALSVNAHEPGLVSVRVAATNAAGESGELEFRILVGYPVVHVNPAATGTGTGGSWQDAFTTLHDALGDSAGVSYFQVWVKAGVYYPDEGGDHSDDDPAASFNMRNWVEIYGGFAGTETELSQRQLGDATETILSGDLAQDDVNIDGNQIAETPDDHVGVNTIHIVNASSIGTSAVIDGFTITAGQAGDQPGGGLWGGSPSSAIVRNCRFLGNSAQRGGAVYVKRSFGTISGCEFRGNRATYGGALRLSASRCDVEDCLFVDNTAIQHGGAIDSYDGGPRLTACRFENNVAGEDGGAFRFFYFQSGGSATLTDCEFVNNEATRDGGAVFSSVGSRWYDCRFTGNTAGQNGGAFGASNQDNSFDVTDIELADCTFSSNVSTGDGGALWIHDGRLDLAERCLFEDNSAGASGGAIFLRDCSAVLRDSQLTGNSAATDGGSIALVEVDLEFTYLNLRDCLLSSNTAVEDGGAIYGSRSTIAAEGCRLLGNSAASSGGAVYNPSSSSFANCLFSGNHASIGGVGYHASADLYTNCTMTANSASNTGGVLRGGSTTPVQIRNCIIWNNSTNGEIDSDESFLYPGSYEIAFSNVANSGGSENWVLPRGIDGGDNTDIDPGFLIAGDPAMAPSLAGDFRLQAGSPMIDQGDDAVPTSNFAQPYLTDVLGFVRRTDGDGDGSSRIDIGAHEFLPPGTDSDSDGFTDLTEHQISGSASDLAFPTVSMSSTSDGVDQFPSFVYHADMRLDGVAEFVIEQSSDLGQTDPWEMITLIPISSSIEADTLRVELRMPDPVSSVEKEFLRLRVNVPAP